MGIENSHVGIENSHVSIGNSHVIELDGVISE